MIPADSAADQTAAAAVFGSKDGLELLSDLESQLRTRSLGPVER
jgi:hypothetical protein